LLWGTVSVLVIVEASISQPIDTVFTRKFDLLGRDYATGLCQTADTGYIVCGITGQGNETSQAFLMRLSHSGSQVWYQSYVDHDFTGAECVIALRDGGFIAAGSSDTHRGATVVKVDANGSVLWQFYSPYFAAPFLKHAAVEASQGDILVAQSGGAGSSGDIYLLLLTAAGDTLWTRRFGGPGIDIARALFEDSTGGFVVLGCSDTVLAGTPSLAPMFLRIDRDGSATAERLIPRDQSDVWISSGCNVDGVYVMSGYEESQSGGARRSYLAGLAPGGDTLWTRTLNAIGDCEPWGCTAAGDSEFVVVGPHGATPCAASLTSTGSIRWETEIAQVEPSYPFAVVSSGFGAFVTAGYTADSSRDAYVVAYEPSSNARHERDVRRETNELLCFPNPFNLQTTVRYSVPIAGSYSVLVDDILGRRVMTFHLSWLPPGEHSTSLDGSQLPSGTYIVRLTGPSVLSIIQLRLIK
jgi:hypothetical protein